MTKTLQGSTPGEKFVILENNHQLVMEKTFPTNQRWETAGVLHVHPFQDEHFEVYEGILSVKLDGRERTYVGGEAFSIPRGSIHLMCNQGQRPVRVRWTITPAMRALEFFEVAISLQRAGKMDHLLQKAVFVWEYRDLYRPAVPPPWLQPMVFAPLAFLGRLLGYRTRDLV